MICIFTLCCHHALKCHMSSVMHPKNRIERLFVSMRDPTSNTIAQVKKWDLAIVLIKTLRYQIALELIYIP